MSVPGIVNIGRSSRVTNCSWATRKKKRIILYSDLNLRWNICVPV